MAAGGISEDEFNRLQGELIKLKQEKYESKDREARMARQMGELENKFKNADKAQKAAEKARANAEKAQKKAEDKLQNSKDARNYSAAVQQAEALQRQLADLREEHEAQSSALQEANRNMFQETKTLRDEVERLKAQVAAGGGSSESGAISVSEIELQKKNSELVKQNEDLMNVLEMKNKEVMGKEADLDRVMTKLSDAQVQNQGFQDKINFLNDEKTRLLSGNEAKQKELNDIIQTLSEKLEEASKKAAADSDARVAEATQARVQSLTDSMATLHSDMASVKRKYEAQEEVVAAQKKELEELRQATTLQSYEVTELKEEVEQKTATIDSLRQELERASQKYQSEITSIKSEWEEKYAALEGIVQSRDKANEELTEELRVAQEQMASADSHIQTLREELAQREAEVEEAKEATTQLQASMEDGDVERKIEARKRNQLVKELKTQLQKATQQIARLDAELKVTQQEKAEAAARHQRTNSDAKSDTGSQGSQGSLSRSSSDQAVTRPRKQGLDRTGSTQSGAGDDTHAEMNEALISKLQDIQEQKFAMSQKIEFLESNIQLLNADVEKKRILIQYYQKRHGAGALTTDEHAKATERFAQTAKDPKRQAELLAKMELILQETTLENVHLRDTKGQLAKEIARLTKLVAGQK